MVQHGSRGGPPYSVVEPFSPLLVGLDTFDNAFLADLVHKVVQAMKTKF